MANEHRIAPVATCQVIMLANIHLAQGKTS